MGYFGWSEDTKADELIALRKFFANTECDTERCAEILRSFLVTEVSRGTYSESSTLYVYEDACRLFQYGEKEHYHDGSCEPRKNFFVEKISEDEYLSAKSSELALQTPTFSNYNEVWYSELSDYFFVKRASYSYDYDVYARDFLSVGYVKLSVDKMY